MSELVVVFAVCVIGLLLAGVQMRRVFSRGTAHYELERLLAAVQRACADFLWQETKLLALLLAIVTVALGCPLAIWGNTTGGHAESLGWSVAGLCLGAAAGTAVAYGTQWVTARATATAVEALREDVDGAARATFRGALAVAVGVDAASLLITSFFFATHYAYLTLMGKADVNGAIFEASRSLPAAALGALCAGAIFQVGGSSFHTAAGVAGTAARARHPHIARDEERNPALVAELVGNHVGGAVCRSTDVFSALLLGNCGLVVVAGLVAQRHATVASSALAIAALPMVIRGMGLLAAIISMSSLRFEGPLGLTQVFAAARASHALLLATGLVGSALWLLGDPLYVIYAGAGILGILAGALSSALLFVGSRRLDAATADASGPPRSDTSVARALGLGLQYTWSPLLVVGSCLGAAWLLGAQAPLEHGGAFGLVVAVAGMLGASAFNLGESVFSAMSEISTRVTGLRRGQFDEATRARAASLEHAGHAIGNLGHTQCILGGAAAALLASVMLPLIPFRAGPASGALDVTVSFAHPVVLLGGVLGAGSLLFHVGGVLRSSSRAASALDRNLEDRLEADAHGSMAGALPSYRDSLQLATAGATHTLLPLVLTALLTPFAIGVLLRVVYGPLGSALTVRGLMALGTIAALTGCCAALAAQGTLVALAAQRRVHHAAGGLGSLGTGSASEFMSSSVVPAALLGLKASVVSSFATVPLLFST